MSLRHVPRPFDPLKPDHPLVGQRCGRCGCPFNAGDVPCLVDPQPAGGDEARKASEGRAYLATATPAHWACVVEAQ